MRGEGPFESCDAALNYLYHFTDYERMAKPRDRATSVFGLARMNQLLEFLGNPQLRLKAIHIAGTKGKGSTAAMVAAILRSAGASVGLYTSPHVLHVRERIMVDGQWIAEPRLTDHINTMYPYLQDSLKTSAKYTPTFFEIFTAAAFLEFVGRGVDYAVFEVGLGGRLDATNVLAPVVCGITHISFDHTDKLGNTLREIASEKAGILKRDVPAVVAPQEPEALAAIEAKAKAVGAPLVLVGRDVPLRNGRTNIEVTTPLRTYRRLKVPLAGYHQRQNAATAVALAETACERTGRRLTARAVRDGLQAVRWRARIEVVAERPTVVVDAAHNVASIRALLDTLERTFRFKRLVLVVGISADKDVGGILRELVPRASLLLTTRSQSPRAAAPEELARQARAIAPVETIASPDPCQALALARQKAACDDLVCVTGSFYVAGEVIAGLEGA